MHQLELFNHFKMAHLTTQQQQDQQSQLNAAIPFVVPSAAALSIVIVDPAVVELLSVNAPEIADPPVPPAIERTPVFEIVIAPPRETGEPDTPIPVPLLTVIVEF